MARFRYPTLVATVLLAFACGGTDPTGPASSLEGRWGGEHVALDVATDSSAIEYDCAHGTIDEPLTLDGNANFVAIGTYTRESPGPIQLDEPPDRHPARYSGSVVGSRMTLTVTLADSGEVVGTFNLELGNLGRVFKCV
jgi:hypothetical protein